MFAVIVEAQVAPGKREEYEEALAEYMALRAQQPGAGRTTQVAAGEDREFIVFCWDSEEQSDRAHADVLIAAAMRLFPPVLAAPQQVLGFGKVTREWP